MTLNDEHSRIRICETHKEALQKVNEYSFIKIWNKIYKIRNLTYFFK